MNGDVLAVVYFNKSTNEFFVQVADPKGGFLTLGPMPAYIFENLTKIMSDVKDMERRYLYLD